MGSVCLVLSCGAGAPAMRRRRVADRQVRPGAARRVGE